MKFQLIGFEIQVKLSLCKLSEISTQIKWRHRDHDSPQGLSFIRESFPTFTSNDFDNNSCGQLKDDVYTETLPVNIHFFKLRTTRV